MLLELNLRLNWDFGFGPERLKMSRRSETLAAYARRFMENQPQADAAALKRNQILDEGFARLRADLISEFQKQVDELDHEPGCAGSLICKFSDDRSEICRSDETSILSIKFDAPKRLATISCDKPTKFKHLVGVRLTNDQTGWYYCEGKTPKELSATNDRIVPVLVEKGLCALFGVD